MLGGGGERKEWKASRHIQVIAFIPFYSLRVSASLLTITRYLIQKVRERNSKVESSPSQLTSKIRTNKILFSITQ